MSNAETAQHLRKWVADMANKGPFSWPTDACGYDQHIRFVHHRNANWHGEGTFGDFVLAYADRLEAEPEDVCRGCGAPWVSHMRTERDNLCGECRNPEDR